MIEKLFRLSIKTETGTIRRMRFVTIFEALSVLALELQKHIDNKTDAGAWITHEDNKEKQIYVETVRNGEIENTLIDKETILFMEYEMKFQQDIYFIITGSYCLQELNEEQSEENVG